MKKAVDIVIPFLLVMLVVSCSGDDSLVVSCSGDDSLVVSSSGDDSLVVSSSSDDSLVVSRSAQVFGDDGAQAKRFDFTMRLPKGWEIYNDWVIEYLDFDADTAIILQSGDCTAIAMDTNLKEMYLKIVEGQARLVREQVIIAAEDYPQPSGNTGCRISYSMDYEDTGITYYCDYHVWVDDGLCLYIQFFSSKDLMAYQPMFNDIIASIMASPNNS